MEDLCRFQYNIGQDRAVYPLPHGFCAGVILPKVFIRPLPQPQREHRVRPESLNKVICLMQRQLIAPPYSGHGYSL